jgi:iron-sulfur cluster repair protein YtfE (RIC family)
MLRKGGKYMFGKSNHLENCPKSIQESFKTLNLFLPRVKKIHGAEHPELTEVEQVTNELQAVLEDGMDTSRTTALLERLRNLTKNYAIPSDACPAYKNAYKALSQIDAILSAM